MSKRRKRIALFSADDLTVLDGKMTDWDEWLTPLEGERVGLESRIQELDTALAVDQTKRRILEEARDVINAAIGATQGEVCSLVEELVTAALEAVYGDGYGFELNHRMARNQIEAIPRIIKDGEEYDPRGDVGVGIVDVASFVSRLAMWALEGKSTRATFVLDEPFKFVSKDRTMGVSQMLNGLVEALGIQVIMVSHDEGIAAAANKAWVVEQSSVGVSKATVLHENPITAADLKEVSDDPKPRRKKRKKSEPKLQRRRFPER